MPLFLQRTLLWRVGLATSVIGGMLSGKCFAVTPVDNAEVPCQVDFVELLEVFQRTQIHIISVSISFSYLLYPRYDVHKFLDIEFDV